MSFKNIPVVWVTVIFIGVCYFLLAFYMPSVGDDIGFTASFANQNDAWYAWPRYMYRHWLWNNGRLADMISPLTLCILPTTAGAILNGLLTAGLFVGVSVNIPWRTPGRQAAIMLLFFLMIFTLRWDALWMEFITQYNYVYAATLILLAIRYAISFRENRSRWRWLLLPVCFAAGAMHEACGVPAACGLTFWLLASDFRKGTPTLSLLTVIAIILGGLFTLSSPGSYSRLGSLLQPESPLSILLLSNTYTVILTIIVILTAIFNRKKLLEIIHTPWVIFAIAAIVSTLFSLLSQYGGRTGWFAQIFGLTALFIYVSQFPVSIPRIGNFAISAVAAACIFIHLSMVVVTQKRVATETREIFKLLETTDSEVIYYDYLREPELSPLLLRKVHCFPDEDDSYYRYRIAGRHHKGRNFVVLPTDAKPLDLAALTESVRISNGILSPRQFEKTHNDALVRQFPRKMVVINDEEHIERTFSVAGKRNSSSVADTIHLYYYTPTDRDPGEK